MATQRTSMPKNTHAATDEPANSVENVSGLVKALEKLSIPAKPSTGAVVEDTEENAPPPMYEFESPLPYSYTVEHSPTNLSQSCLEMDLKTFKHALTGSIPGLALRLSIDTFPQRTASEMALVRSEFRKMNETKKTFIPAFDEVLDVLTVPSAFKLAYRGLVLGPLLFDLWILQNDFESRENILIDILIGRNADDLHYLDIKFQRQSESHGRLSSIVGGLTSSPELLAAFTIATVHVRPPASQPVDPSLVVADVQEIGRLLSVNCPLQSLHDELFDILLRRNDHHLAQINLYFRMKEGKDLYKIIRKSSTISKVTRKVAVHAIRSAIDLVDRDVALLRLALEGDGPMSRGNNDVLGVRVCRMHWYRQHWLRVQEGFRAVMNKNLLDVLKSKGGLFRDLMVALTRN